MLMIVSVVIPKEEANLIKTFGNAYHTYMKHTGKLLPHLRR